MGNKDLPDNPRETTSRQLDGVSKVAKKSFFSWKSFVKLLLLRVPSWLILIILILWGGFSLYNSITRVEPVNLRPIVYNARELNITFSVCDDVLRDNNLEVLETEKRMERQFIERERVDKVNIRINRAQPKECLTSDQSK